MEGDRAWWLRRMGDAQARSLCRRCQGIKRPITIMTADGIPALRRDLKDNDPEVRQAAHEAVFWSLRNRAGSSHNTYFGGHHRPSWWTIWSETHPEFIGLYRGQRGVRRSPPDDQPNKLLERGWPLQDFSGAVFPALTLENVRQGLVFCRDLEVVGFLTEPDIFL